MMATPHIVYIFGAYLGVGVITAALIGVTIIDARILKRRLKALEQGKEVK